MELYEAQQRQVDASRRNWVYQAGLSTGKTFISLAHYDKWGQASPLVVIAPKAAVVSGQWDESIRRWYQGRMAPSYELFTTDGIKRLDDDYFTDKYVIVDEAHKFKAGSKSQRADKLRLLLMRSTGFCMLTGTPANGDLVRTPRGYELCGGHWEDLLGYLGCFQWWKWAHGQPSLVKGFDRRPTAYTTRYQLRRLVRQYAMVREQWNQQLHRNIRVYEYKQWHPLLSVWWPQVAGEQLRVDDIAELPGVVEREVWLKPSPLYRKPDVVFESAPARRVWQRTHQNNPAKLEWVRNLFESTRENIVVFYNFNSEFDSLLDVARKTGKTVHVVNGVKKTRFLHPGPDAVCLVQVSAGGAAIELTEYPVNVYYSLPDSYIDFTQSLGRSERLGQDRKVLRFFLLVKGTVDVAIKKALDEKHDWRDESDGLC